MSRTASGGRTGTVVVPAYNEGELVGRTLPRIADALHNPSLSARRWEIIVVDDGSADDTAAHAAAAATDIGQTGITVRVLRHTSNRGLGGALQTGIAASTGDVVVAMDCDLSYHPDHIIAMVRALEDNSAQIAIASPYMPGGRALGLPPQLERRSRTANRFLNKVSRTDLHTLTGMVRAYDGPFVRELALKANNDIINVEALYKTKVLRGRMVEVPGTLDWRGLEARAVRSAITSKRTRTKVYETIVSGLLFRPYMVFMAGGLSLVGLGGVLGLLAMLLPGVQLGLTVLGVSLVGTGLLIAFTSLLSVQVKRCFEELYFLQSPARRLVTGFAGVEVGAAEAAPIQPPLPIPSPALPSTGVASMSLPGVAMSTAMSVNPDLAQDR